MTDGSVEEDTNIGGVCYDAADGALDFFGSSVPELIQRSWGRMFGEEQVIGQAELALLVVALRLWEGRLRDRQLIMMVDGDAARQGTIRGYSPSIASAHLIAELWLCIAAFGTDPWFDRVPGPSNLADGPSRLQTDQVRKLGGREVAVRPSDWRAVTIR